MSCLAQRANPNITLLHLRLALFQHVPPVAHAEHTPEDPRAPQLAAEEEVLRDRQGRRQRQVLIHGLDACAAGVHWTSKAHLASIEQNAARVGDEGTRE